jgi:uncharacterized glyoxalase superfamily protein PhnB
MKPTPLGWPRISSGVFYRDAAAMIDWLCRAFGFEVRIKVVDDDGRVEHSELAFGDGHCARARAAGATVVEEPSLHDYGEAYWADRAYGATDPEGHLWWFVQRLRNPPQ